MILVTELGSCIWFNKMWSPEESFEIKYDTTRHTVDSFFRNSEKSDASYCNFTSYSFL